MEEKTEKVKANLVDRKKIDIVGVKKVNSATPKNVTVKLSQSSMSVSGSELNVEKLDLESGVLSITGNIDSVDFSKNKGKNESVLKRIFK